MLIISLIIISQPLSKCIADPSAQLISPNGGEKWYPASKHFIDFTFSDISFQDIRLTYSPDNGKNWLPMVFRYNWGIPIPNEYQWHVPYTPSDSCLVKICDQNSNILDISDSTFTIIQFLNDTTFVDSLGIQHIIAIDKQFYTQGDTVRMCCEVKNINSDSITLEFPCSQEYEFWTTNWTSFGGCLAMAWEKTLRENEYIIAYEEWDMVDTTGNTLPEGNYDMFGIITYHGVNGLWWFYPHYDYYWALNVPFSITTPVPVELSFFDVTYNNYSVLLRWMTESESNNLGFYVEKSTDNVNFNELGFVKGHGTTSHPQEYTYVDENLRVDKIYYRLKQVDFNGTIHYSQVKELTRNIFPKELSLLQNYPNPFNSSTKISFYLPKRTHINLSIFDLLGRKLITILEDEFEAGAQSIQFEASNLSSGLYLYKLESDGIELIKKLVILK